MNGFSNFRGFKRSDGSVGIRNHIAIISTVACANHVVDSIAQGYPNAVPITHQHGCDQLGKDLDLFFNTLLGIAKNGNVAAVLVVGLGCEEISAFNLAKSITKIGKPAASLIIQEVGGTSASILEGKKRLNFLCSSLTLKEEDIDFSKLIIGLKCGGSDFSSGIITNPAVGEAVDLLLQKGAKVVFGETTELLGAEEVIRQKAQSSKIKTFILDKIHTVEESAILMRVDIRGAQPSPGNIEGGLSTIEEKSLGAVCKIGNSKINNVLNFAQPCCKPGLSFMDTPGNDILTMAGLAAGGAQVIIFTTGRGTPMGFATVPVIKVCASPKTVHVMKENIDVDISPFFFGKISLSEAGRIVFDSVIETARGKHTKAEILGHREFGIRRIGPTL